jgi:FkbM family methyltransferase
MGLKREIFDLTSNTIIKGFGLNRANKLLCNFTQKIAPISSLTRDGKEYRFHCPNELTRWRAETFFTKEPETIDWIDGFKQGDVLFDIGANVGLYSIYAAKRGIRVVAFEPESQNFALINRNLFLNGLADDVIGLNVAISDKDGMDYLFMPDFQPGGALNNVGEAVDLHHKEFKPHFKQGVITFSLDSFISHYPDYFPTHIKLDVDGLEAKIICGAEKTLRDPRLKSLLIEINENLPEDRETCAFIENLGLKFLHKKHSEMASQGDFKSLINYVFTRA